MIDANSRLSVRVLCLAALLAAVMATGAVDAWAQTPGGGPSSAAPRANGAEPAANVTTRTGHEMTVGIGGYTYIEPGDLRISIHGPKLSFEYTGTLSLNERKHWFIEAGLRLSGGTVSYDGWCLPWLIRPDGRSANGYALGLGDASPCSFGGDADGYVEMRALAGKDLLTGRWGVSPISGLGVRYLSNGTTGIADFRTDTYLYVPLGVTARTCRIRSRRQRQRGVRPPAARLANDARIAARRRRNRRHANRARVHHRWLDRSLVFPAPGMGIARRGQVPVDPTLVGGATVHSLECERLGCAFTTATFTVNGITTDQDLGAVEPVNSTNEWSVNVGFHF